MSTPDAAREQARQDNGQFGTQHKAEVDVILTGEFENSAVTDARRAMQVAQSGLRDARHQHDAASLRYAAVQILDRHPDARYLILATSEDESWSTYLSHAEDADGEEVAGLQDLYADPWAQDIQMAVMDLPKGGTTAVPCEDYPTVMFSDLVDPYKVDIHDLFNDEQPEPEPARTGEQIRLDDARESRGQARFRLSGAVDAEMDPLALQPGDEIKDGPEVYRVKAAPVRNDDGSIMVVTDCEWSSCLQVTYEPGRRAKVRHLAPDTATATTNGALR